ncbi:E3 ubiquitin-protein ligase RNF13 [Stylophora pistillata]|uniref:E3 ubiquitin-protein ligase RNF13 n=1 Tax=Stylophora pistillata TaxID=50429 RepID=A0A2B4S1A3_STYPI|nr:E3 ubiquitin-protein ligase RNF13 [Stylophora pistillata]
MHSRSEVLIMTSGPWWIIEGLLFLHVSQFGFCDYKDNVCVNFNGTGREECYDYGWATFGTVIASRFKGVVFMANPRDACSKVSHKNSYTNISYDGKSVEASRGGFDAAIIRSLEDDDVHSMDEGTTDGGEVNLPAVYVGKTTGEILEDNDYRNMPNLFYFDGNVYAYHCKCVDPWLTEGKRTCPVCKRPVANDTGLTRSRSGRNDMESMGETSYEAEPEAEANERTPLISTTSQSRASITMTV